MTHETKWQQIGGALIAKVVAGLRTGLGYIGWLIIVDVFCTVIILMLIVRSITWALGWGWYFEERRKYGCG